MLFRTFINPIVSKKYNFVGNSVYKYAIFTDISVGAIYAMSYMYIETPTNIQLRWHNTHNASAL